MRTLDDVLGLASPPPHISAYALTVEPGTPLAADPDRHPDEDALADRYELADRSCSDGRLPLGGDLQLGPARPRVPAQPPLLGAGRLRGHRLGRPQPPRGRRWWNVRTPDRYVAAIESGRPGTSGEEVLTAEQRTFEALTLSLRTPAGVPLERCPTPPSSTSWSTGADGRAVLTVRGRLLANAVTTRLVAGAVADSTGASRYRFAPDA